MPGDDFASLLRSAKQGDDAAWHVLVGRYSPSLLGYVRRVGAGDPEDALSEVWYSASRKIFTFEGDEPAFRSWLFVIAHRRAIDEGRRAARRPTPVADVPDLIDRGSAHDPPGAFADDVIEPLLGVLTLDQRAVVLLRVIADMSLAETARVLDKRIGAVKALQRRALERLRREIDERGVSF